MLNLPPKSRPVKAQSPFARRGIKLHGDIDGIGMGNRTQEQQNADLQHVAALTDPVTGGLLPQDRVERYEGQ